MRFLRAEEIKELLAWTAQELQTVQDSAAQGNPASGAAWSLFLRMTTIPVIASMAHSRFPRGFPS